MPYKQKLDPKEFAARLKEVIADAEAENSGAPVIPSAVAKRYGVKPPTATQWLDGQFLPKAEKVRAMAEDYRCSFDWLYFGQGNKRTEASYQGSLRERGPAVPWRDHPEAFPIPLLNVGASMGDGSFGPEHVDLVRSISVNLADLRKKIHFSSPQNLSFITGYGPSMEPTYFDGDLLLVDEGVQTVEIDAVFVFLLNDKLYIKTLQRTPSGSLMMISDNKKFLPYEINGKDSLLIRGRVLLALNAKRI